MNKSEESFHNEALSKGFLVYRRGWPDFAVRKPGDSAFFVEVKRSSGVSHDQNRMFQLLADNNLPTYISLNGDWIDLDYPYIPTRTMNYAKLSKQIRQSQDQLTHLRKTYLALLSEKMGLSRRINELNRSSRLIVQLKEDVHGLKERTHDLWDDISVLEYSNHGIKTKLRECRIGLESFRKHCPLSKIEGKFT